MKNLKTVFIFLIITGFFSCSEDYDTSISANQDEEVDRFIWRTMNKWYLYKSDVMELSDDRFSNDQKQYLKFLSNFDTPINLFEALCSNKRINGRLEDRFSSIIEDYVALENSFDGVSLSNGLVYELVKRPGSVNKLLGVIRYVLPGSEAETKGIKRGQYFSSVNGIDLNVKTKL